LWFVDELEKGLGYVEVGFVGVVEFGIGTKKSN
jgi:hypothetical protein